MRHKLTVLIGACISIPAGDSIPASSLRTGGHASRGPTSDILKTIIWFPLIPGRAIIEEECPIVLRSLGSFEEHISLTIIGSFTRCFSQPCSKCKERKPLVSFYEKGTRRESLCKDCKKALRKANYASVSSIARAEQPLTAAMDGYSNISPPDRSYIEPQQDDSFWDKMYGRNLSKEEKREISFNLNSLVLALRSAI